MWRWELVTVMVVTRSKAEASVIATMALNSNDVVCWMRLQNQSHPQQQWLAIAAPPAYQETLVLAHWIVT